MVRVLPNNLVVGDDRRGRPHLAEGGDGVESDSATSTAPNPKNCGDSMTEEAKHAILFSATILAARIGGKPCRAREACIEDAICNAD